VYVLGISAYYHDSAAALLKAGVIVAAAQEERFTRKKHDESFPKHAVAYCLKQAGISLSELDVIVFYDKPLLKFERLLETYMVNAPKGFRSFLKAIPLWLKQKLFFKRELYKALDELGEYDKEKLKIIFTEHHVSHAASTFFASPFQEAAVLTIDGVGEWATTTICKGKGNALTVLKETHFPHSLGLFYSAITYYCGFKVNSGEYKLMGLAPYGNRDSEDVARFVKLLKEHVITVYEDGSLFLDQRYYNYATGLTMANDTLWEGFLTFKKREAESPLDQQYINLALAAQIITEEIVLLLAKEAIKITGSDCLCLAGGVALNCVANGKLVREGIAKHVYLQPASGDCGGALGAAWAAHYIYSGNERILTQPDNMQGAYLGPEYSKAEIEEVLPLFDVGAQYIENPEELARQTATYLKEGKIIGWFQGRMEFGPRALGNRSILADARDPGIQKRLNLSIKFRESFRPFAPAVLEEYANAYFDLPGTSPYMLQTQPLSEAHRLPLPPGYEGSGLGEKLHAPKSRFPAITHVDFSARIQTVHKSTNPRFHALISAFYAQTQCPMLVNTSFNLRGEPIVCTPSDALNCLMNTNIDYLVLGNYIIKKNHAVEIVSNPHLIPD
jgi:carbamoyltransferase